MIKEKQREKKKSVSPNSGNLDGNGTSSASSESRDDEICEKSSDIKDEAEEQMTEIRETLSTHASPLDEVKSSPTPAADKDVVTPLLQNSCKPLKPENGENTDPNFRNDSCDNVLPINIPSDSLHEGVQPLPSNVINKQPVSMETQYMQQQSQIFVFSTSLANKAAEAVMQGQFTSIIAYHCSQPRTKKYLEGGGQPSSMSNVAPPCGNNIGLDQGMGKSQHNNHPGMVSNHPSSLMRDSMMANLGEFNAEMGMGGHQPLTGVKIPDENLTPQQRQHREEQLATLRKMQQILFPEALGGQENGSTAQTGPPQPQPTHMDDVMLTDSVDMNKTSSAQSDWQKIHIQFYEDPKHKKNRTTGPPPSYQQATRSASVPIAMPSPNPSSPNNATSNLSLPSPRTCSGINSPADKVNSRIPGPSPTVDSPNPARSTSSNPPTPVSIHLSPKHKDKLSTANEFSPSSSVSAPNSQQSPDSLYCRTVPSGLPQSKQTPNSSGKEPNLMPVPSPQQIQYLNAFEGQELTIQKQPNTSLKESGNKTPTMQSSSLEILPNNNNQCNNSGNASSANSASGNNNNNPGSVNTPPVGDIQSKMSGPPTPSTPDIANRGNFTTDIGTPDSTEKQSNQAQRKLDTPFCNSPQAADRCAMNIPNNYLQKGPSYLEPTKCSLNEKDLSNGNYQCMGPANVPLNPNGLNVSTASKSSHFDPISSLAQMSQQLTNNVPNSPVSQPPMMGNMHQNLVPYATNPNNNPHLMPLNDMHHMPNAPPDHRLQNPMQQTFNNAPRMAPCPNNVNPNMSVSPKLMQNYGVPRPMPRGMAYNGTNVQVKPNAPNTIQYLPSRPQANAGSRGPPSLDFLQRFSNPLSNLDAKVPTHNLQYFPNSYPQGGMNDMGMCSPHGQIRPPVRNPNPGMMRLQSPQMAPMGFNNPEMYSNPNNCQMFGPGGKPGPLGMAPDASQPLPPSMGQSNNFKNSSFIGPTTADPNYAQQFHNFQQQLYATTTRGQLNSQSMAGNQHYFMPK